MCDARHTLVGIHGATRGFSPADDSSERAPTPAQASRVLLQRFPRNACLTLPDADTLALPQEARGATELTREPCLLVGWADGAHSRDRELLEEE